MKVAPENDLLDTRTVAKALMVTPGTVRALLRAGKFPNATRPGRGWLVPRSDLNNYIEEKYK